MKNKLSLLFILSLVSASPAVGESVSAEARLEDPSTNCYDVYQPQFVDVSVELGQLVGANTDAAVEILINNPAPELVG